MHNICKYILRHVAIQTYCAPMYLIHIVAWHDILVLAAQHVTEGRFQLLCDNRTSVSVINAYVCVYLASQQILV